MSYARAAYGLESVVAWVVGALMGLLLIRPEGWALFTELRSARVRLGAGIDVSKSVKLSGQSSIKMRQDQPTAYPEYGSESQSSTKYSLLPLIERLKFTLSPKGYPTKLLA
jgi:hypothetical protein